MQHQITQRFQNNLLFRKTTPNKEVFLSNTVNHLLKSQRPSIQFQICIIIKNVNSIQFESKSSLITILRFFAATSGLRA